MTVRPPQRHYTPAEWASLGPRQERADQVILAVVAAAAAVAASMPPLGENDNTEGGYQVPVTRLVALQRALTALKETKA